MKSPVRRVLGTKDKNAPININSLNNLKPNSKSTPAASRNSEKHKTMSEPSQSPRAGIKRKIDEVEDAERVDQNENADNNDSLRTQLLSDSENEDETLKSSTRNIETSYETADASLSASQTTIELQFELQQEEMSQRTLDTLNAVPMPQNTSQLPPLRPGLLKEMSAGSVGLSHFINFEDLPSTQGSDDMLQPILEESKDGKERSGLENAVKSAETEAAARKKMLDEKAAELKTRLQLALYKVQTKQTSQPFSRLKTPKSSQQRSSSPLACIPRLATPQLSSSTVRPPSSARTVGPSYPLDRSIDSAEAHIAALRAQAANQNKPPVKDLNSLPTPQLDPSLLVGDESFASARTLPIDRGSQEPQQFPSSPPLSRHSSSASKSRLLPGLQEAVDADKHVQPSSPPASEGMVGDVALTKTVSQGEAASGLVQLMTGRS